jgi:hypothetical protein
MKRRSFAGTSLEGTILVTNASSLLRLCQAAISNGDSFPTIWNTILSRSSIVIGPPIQRLKDGRPVLEIKLINGQRLTFESRVFRLS